MPRAALSNRQRRSLAKIVPAQPRYPKVGEAEREVKVADPATRAQEPTDRDGLVWLAKKKRLTPSQIAAGFYYRDLVRACPGGLKSCLDAAGGGVYNAGKGGGLPFGGDFSEAGAQLELFVVRSFTLANNVEMLTVMDGVCGAAHTVRYLAGGDQMRAVALEAVLRVALDLVAEARAAKAKAQPKAA